MLKTLHELVVTPYSVNKNNLFADEIQQSALTKVAVPLYIASHYKMRCGDRADHTTSALLGREWNEGKELNQLMQSEPNHAASSLSHCLQVFCLLLGVSFGAPQADARVLLPDSVFLESSEAEFWNGVEIPLSEIRERIINRDQSRLVCAQSEHHYLRCFNMLMAIASFFEREISLVFLDSDYPTDTDSQLLRFGDIQIIISPKQPFRSASLFEIKSLQSNILRLYGESASPGFDLLSFFYWLEANVLSAERNQKRVSEIILTGLNAWYQTDDPFARFVSKDLHEDSLGKTDFQERVSQLEANYIGLSAAELESRTKTGYIHLKNFYVSLAPVQDKIYAFRQSGINGLIIDLRGNYGSYLNDMAQTLDLFLMNVVSAHAPDAPVLFFTQTINSNSDITRYYSTRRDLIPNTPIVVITDHTVASAAEVFAGALQVWRRAWILGDRTFGKGTQLDVFPAFSNLGYLYQSTRIMYLPDGSTPHLWGIEPDFFVDPSPQPRITDYYAQNLPTDNPRKVRNRYAETAQIENCVLKLQREIEEPTFFVSEKLQIDPKIRQAYFVLRCLQPE